MKIKTEVRKLGDIYYLHIYHLEERYKYSVQVDTMWICGQEQKYVGLSCYEDTSYGEPVSDNNWMFLDRVEVPVPFEFKDYTCFDGGIDKEEQKFVFIPTKNVYGTEILSTKNFVVQI